MLKDPEAYGIDRIEPTLGSISLEADGEESASESLKILKKFKYSQLSEEQKMCYSILEAYLTVEQMAEGMEYYVEICSPGHFAKTYFDYKQFARDLFMCDYWFDDGFVFRAA